MEGVVVGVVVVVFSHCGMECRGKPLLRGGGSGDMLPILTRARMQAPLMVTEGRKPAGAKARFWKHPAKEQW